MSELRNNLIIKHEKKPTLIRRGFFSFSCVFHHFVICKKRVNIVGYSSCFIINHMQMKRYENDTGGVSFSLNLRRNQ
jgi:hypothetical protein